MIGIGFLSSIRGKLVLACAGLVGAIAVFAATFFPWRMERQAMSDIVARAEAVRNMTAYSISAAMVFGDTAAMRDVIAAAFRDQTVVAVVARDVNGHELVAAGGQSLGAPGSSREGVSDDRELYVTAAPVLHDGQRVGSLELGMSLRQLREDVKSARRLGIAIGFGIFVISLGVVYAIGLLVTRPLRDVARTVTRIAAGDLSIRAEGTRDREISDFVGAFNDMVGALAGTQTELSSMNRELEQRVHDRTETLRTVIDVAPQGIISVDLEWRVRGWNRAAERLFGYTADEVIGMVLPTIPEETMEAFVAAQQVLHSGRNLPPTQYVLLRKDGSRVNVLVAAAPLLDAKQAQTGYVGILTDITERMLLEDQLRQSQKMEAVGRLAGGVAHDFNNILTVITATASLLLETELDAESRRDVEEISTAALRAAALTRQLLAFTRSQVVNLEAVNLNDVVTRMRPMLRRLLRENIRVSLETTDPLHHVKADVSQIEQVILNLVVNASDAMPEGGSLSVATRNVTLDAAYARERVNVTPGEYTMLVVTDTGVGMTPATMARMFEPFFTTKPIGKGTGLGLATTYAIVQRFGGHIEAQSHVGVGTAFRIYLPMYVDEASECETESCPPEGSVAGTETVLLVEDEDPVRIAMKRSLERLGYTVLEASNGETGLSALAERGEDIDVVVTDVMMPGMTGRAMADHLMLTRPEMPVVFISGYADEVTRERGLVDETHAFMQKPFTGVQLARTIREMLHERARAA